MFSKEMLQRVPWAKVFATWPEDPFHIWHKFSCMICRVNVSMRGGGIAEIKRQNQSLNDLRQDQRSRE